MKAVGLTRPLFAAQVAVATAVLTTAGESRLAVLAAAAAIGVVFTRRRGSHAVAASLLAVTAAVFIATGGPAAPSPHHRLEHRDATYARREDRSADAQR